jgi:septal ring factor EnvC (AmiA/AmiB activator)
LPIKAKLSPGKGAGFGAAAACAVVDWALAGGLAQAASPATRQAETPRGDVRERIETLRRDLAKTEQSRAYAVDQLRATESAISDANRGLRQLETQRGAVQNEIHALDGESRRLAEQTALQQQHLARLLYHYYTHGSRPETDAFSLLLSGRDPNQASLDSQYLKYLSQAKAELIASLRVREKEEQHLADAARDKKAELETIEEKQRQVRAQLLDQQKQRQTVLAQAAEKIKAQRHEIGALQRDEKRLTELLAKLAKQSRLDAARRQAQSPSSSRQPPPTVHNERTLDPAQAGGAFAALRGKLALPVRGEVANRFGKPRPEGGTTWKGLFIRAAEGSEVRAVAAGEVVYADWLRGFGNLLVIDHGNDFLSVYGNNQSNLKEAGQQVAAGEAVATVGNTGGNPESGLYFELRYQGQAFDPSNWVRPR